MFWNYYAEYHSKLRRLENFQPTRVLHRAMLRNLGGWIIFDQPQRFVAKLYKIQEVEISQPTTALSRFAATKSRGWKFRSQPQHSIFTNHEIYEVGFS